MVDENSVDALVIPAVTARLRDEKKLHSTRTDSRMLCHVGGRDAEHGQLLGCSWYSVIFALRRWVKEIRSCGRAPVNTHGKPTGKCTAVTVVGARVEALFDSTGLARAR